MERLTERTALGICGNNERVEHYPLYNIENDEHMAFGLINQCFEKLAEYEDAEEDGLLIRLPCKVRSTVYLIKSKYTKCTRENQEFDEYSCQGCEWLDCDSREEYYIHVNKSVSLEWVVRYSKDFGKTVFLTKAEAEQALAKMKGE